MQDKKIDVDILVNNVGVSYMGNFVEEPMESIETIINLNLITLTALTRLMVPHMISNGFGKVGIRISRFINLFYLGSEYQFPWSNGTGTFNGGIWGHKGLCAFFKLRPGK